MIHLYAGGKFILLKSSFLIEFKQETYSDRFFIGAATYLTIGTHILPIILLFRSLFVLVSGKKLPIFDSGNERGRQSSLHRFQIYKLQP